MRSTFLWSAALALIPLCPVEAQRSDSTSHRADSLRHRIEERFASQVQEQLGLTADQAAKLRATSLEFNGRRREFASRQRLIREQLTAQLRPGVAANQDSVAKLTNALIDLRVAQAQLDRDEMKDQSQYLDAVQRARLYAMRERFVHRVNEVHGHRRGHGEMGRHRHRDRGPPWL
ncbi:MAG: hypothetical protein ACREMZ_00600 [Gemmatimonadales bacterium]